MAEKAIVFIDGGWLYKYRTALFAKSGENSFEIDYSKLPRLLCEDVADALDEDVSLVRTLYFGLIPSSRSGYNTSKQYSFYDFLDSACGYDTSIHEFEMTPDDPHPASSWVDVSLATNLVYYSSIPGAMDIAIIVSDSADLLPAIRRVRSMGRRVQLVGSHRHPLALPGGPRVGDFPPICLDTHAEDMRLVRTPTKRICKQCGCEEVTTWAGAEFFCDKCRGRHKSP